MKRLASLAWVVCLAVTGLARDEFGPLSEAKAQHPEFFEAGAVLEALLGNATWYVYCGDAEKCFSEETDSELFHEAEIQAKTNFYEHFVKRERTKAVDVTVNGARRMYEFADGAMRYVVMGVPKADVQVKVPHVSSASVELSTRAKATPTVVTTSTATVQEEGGVSANDKMKAESEGLSKEGDMSRLASDEGDEDDKVINDEEKLNILRERLKKAPNDFNLRMRMARIFAGQGKTKRAIRNYEDAVRLLVMDGDAERAEKAAAVCEAAEFEEKNGEYALALKHFRVLQHIGDSGQAAKATSSITRLLLHYQ